MTTQVTQVTQSQKDKQQEHSLPKDVEDKKDLTLLGHPVQPSQPASKPAEAPLMEVAKSSAAAHSIHSQLLSNGVTVEWTDQCLETCLDKSWDHRHRFVHGMALVLSDGTRLQVLDKDSHASPCLVDVKFPNHTHNNGQWSSARLTGFQVSLETKEKQVHITDLRLSISFMYDGEKDISKDMNMCLNANRSHECLAKAGSRAIDHIRQYQSSLANKIPESPSWVKKWVKKAEAKNLADTVIPHALTTAHHTVCNPASLVANIMANVKELEGWLDQIFSDPSTIAIPIDAQIGGTWYPCQLMRVPYPSWRKKDEPEKQPWYWVLLGVSEMNSSFWVFAGHSDKAFDLWFYLDSRLIDLAIPGLHCRQMYGTIYYANYKWDVEDLDTFLSSWNHIDRRILRIKLKSSIQHKDEEVKAAVAMSQTRSQSLLGAASIAKSRPC